jgi:prepilin-type N-terminal cleavage/methylation domain-containing protein
VLVSTLLAKRLRPAAGFSLMEMLVAMAVLAITVPAFAVFVSTAYIQSGRTMARSALQTEARAAVDTLVADLRQAYYGDATTSPIVSMSPTALTFYAPDRAQSFRLRKIAYQLSGGKLQRAVGVSTNTDGPPWTGLTLGAWLTQLDRVTSTTIFTYEDANGSVTTNPAEVKRVTVTVTAQPTSSSAATVSYQSSATIRAER